MGTVTLKIEHTNNQDIIKFTSNEILVRGSYQFNNIDEAKISPLAQQLFHLPFVNKVFISANFIAVKRFSIIEWADVEQEVKTQIENYLNNDGILIKDDKTPKTKIPVEVYAESTPNPSVLKFVLNKKLVEQDLEYKNMDDAKNSPLATALFNFPFVNEVFISGNYVSVTKFDSVEWGDITNEIRSFIKQFIFEEKVVVTPNTEPQKKQDVFSQPVDGLDAVSKQVIGILDEYIRPAVAADGGNIMFQSYEKSSKTVHVILQGACSGCPSSTITLKNGIENMLKQLIPGEIEQVVAINH